ncbi:MAG: hypothetical protein WD267_06565 [Balneolales bacterium]
METLVILETILQIFREDGYTHVQGYNRFGYIKETNSSVIVSRQDGQDTSIAFDKIKLAIDAVKIDRSIYHNGPSSLRNFGITHINSPIWSLLRLVPLSDY